MLYAVNTWYNVLSGLRIVLSDIRRVVLTIYKLKPACKDYLWGGRRLVDDFGIEYQGDVCAEAWLLSCHKDGKSLIAEGEYEGRSLDELILEKGREILGSNCAQYKDFPLLIKLIDAKNPLSIQVHPDEEYAMQNENEHGKTEMWYVIRADEGSFLYEGFDHEISRDEFKKRIEEETLEEVLNKVFVKPGDVIYITPGTLHAIGGGVLLAEIQQSSNVTYRIYDYGRVGADGKKRPLHIDKAMDVTKLKRPKELKDQGRYLLNCEYFNVEYREVTELLPYEAEADNSSFVSVIVLEGAVSLSAAGEKMAFKMGESAFILAGSGSFKAEGNGKILITRVS